jgi:translation initiation factor 5B
VLGVDILDGICKLGTPLVVPEKMVPDELNPGQDKMLELGRIIGIQKDGTDVQIAKKGQAVCIKVQGTAAQAGVTYGRHFDHNNNLVSKLSRKSIDLLKENFKDDLQRSDWQLVIKLKGTFGIA